MTTPGRSALARVASWSFIAMSVRPRCGIDIIFNASPAHRGQPTTSGQLRMENACSVIPQPDSHRNR
ncbi:hypothetical protein [Mycolicibacterium novocastrense]|uniref:hypothetical protein n=1 Tax=Mycolicibacterium novocastrense TaxID=59813 RepID=UPI00157BADD4|nr:hypothetical protein [Mycolicibacterium novocastrense]